MKRITRLRLPAGGQSIVEFAFAAPIFFMLVFGTIEFGRLVWTNHELENGTREAMRVAVVRGASSGAPADAALMESVLLDRTAGIDSSVTVSCSNCGGARGQLVTVTSSYDFQPIVTAFIGLDATITLVGESEGVIHH